MTAHNLFDVKEYDKGLYSERQITVTHRDRLTLIALEISQLLAYHCNEPVKLREGEHPLCYYNQISQLESQVCQYESSLH